MENRIIKFRAWDTILKKFVSGYPIGEKLNNGFNLVGIGVDDEHFDEDIILTQYTGLKDKNGVEIFENDILSSRWKCEVYKDITGAYMVKFHTNPKANKPQTLYSYLKSRVKAGTSDEDNVIIGSTFSNPEILTT